MLQTPGNAVRESSASMLALAREDLACYTVANYPAFELPPHLALVADKLEAVERGEIKRLILLLPPRSGKSLLTSIHFPAWYLGRHPDRYVIAASYGQDLADDFGRRVRNTVQAALHRAIFPESKIDSASAAVHRFNLTAGGAYFAVGRGAAITGRGAHLLLIDDPVKDMEEANSPTIRHGLHEWFGSTAWTRLQPGGACVVVQTSWHEDDLGSHILRESANEGWECVSLPAIAETNDPLGRAEGEALWPSRYPLEVLESIRRQIGSIAFSALYQQHPAPPEGRIFQRSWWRRYAVTPTFSRIVFSLDTAFKAKAENDYSALTIWGETLKDGFYLLHAWRGKVEFPELKAKVRAFASEWNPSVILVEDKASGQSLIQELQHDSNLPVVPVKVDSDKVTRATACTGLVEAGKVLLPERAGWLDDFMDEISTFPAAAHDDYVDSTTQALNYLRTGGEGWNVVHFYEAMTEKWSTGTLRMVAKDDTPRRVRVTDAAGKPYRSDPPLVVNGELMLSKVVPGSYAVAVIDANDSATRTVELNVEGGQIATAEV